MFGITFFRRTVALAALLWTLAAPACNVPVFRYALERWEADPYEIVVFHREPFTAEQQALLERMEQQTRDGLANLVLTRVNVADEMPQAWRVLWNAQDQPATPWMVVNYPRWMRAGQSVWAGSLSAEAVAALLDSPARRDLAKSLLSGETTVWLLLESGDKRRDDETARLIEAESRKLEQTLALPELSPTDPQMSADLPLKIAFSTVRVARSNPVERLLVNMLLKWNPNLTSTTEPMLFPVFGRGRVVPPATGDEIQPEAIQAMAEFLTGACSCEVKEMNPGYDLLLAADWDSLLRYGEQRVPDLPLVGLSQFAAPVTNVAATKSNQPADSLVAAGTAPAAVGQANLVRNLVVVLATGIVLLTAATLVLRARANRNTR